MADIKTTDTNNMDFIERTGYTFSLIGKTWQAFKLNWSTFVLLFIIPTVLSLLWISIFLAPYMFGSADKEMSVIVSILGFVVIILLLMVFLIINPALIITQLESVKGKKISVSEALNQSKKFVLRYLGIGILLALIAYAPLVFSFLTMIILVGFIIFPFAVAWAVVVYAALLFAPYVLISQDKDIKTTLDTTFSLLKSEWKWVFAIFIVMFVINLVSVVWFIGWIIAIGLGVAYYCLPAYIFVNHMSPKSNKKDITKS
jgi:hypothetical protein